MSFLGRTENKTRLVEFSGINYSNDIYEYLKLQNTTAHDNKSFKRIRIKK